MRKILISLLVSIFCLGFSGQELTKKGRTFSSKQLEITSSSGSSAYIDRRPGNISNNITRDDTVSVWYDDLEGDISGWVIEDGWELTLQDILRVH